jgi:hypothetical protein
MNVLVDRKLPEQQPGAKGVNVTAIRPNLFSHGTRPADCPLRNSGITRHEVRFVAVMDIRHSLESSGQPFSHSSLSDKSGPPWIFTTRHLEDCVVSKVVHDTV